MPETRLQLNLNPKLPSLASFQKSKIAGYKPVTKEIQYLVEEGEEEISHRRFSLQQKLDTLKKQV